MQTITELKPWGGGDDGFRGDLPLEREVEYPIVLDGSRLGMCHPMFVIRMRLFFDWHLELGHDVSFRPPLNLDVGQHLADSGLVDGLPEPIASTLPSPRGATDALFPLRRLGNAQDVEDASAAATDVLHGQAPALAAWGDPVYMAVSELCGNALQHGQDALGAYVVADRVSGERREFRLAIADLGIGIPEHLRNLYPDWNDDTGAITSALVRGVTGTDDPHRGNGFAEVFEEALSRSLVRSSSAVNVDIRSGAGRAIVELVDGRQNVDRRAVKRSRRGTWITYTVTTV